MQMVKSCTMSIFAYDKRTIEALFVLKKRGLELMVLPGQQFSLHDLNLVYIAP